ncbi:MAG TPA: stage V sporulation protein SpoVM [Candidatus Fimivivens faecavium]|nr:stage V sporulation protein SpoVM [Candidatus Fimivivens faecavium]
MRKMKVVVWKSPRFLTGFFRMIFGMGKDHT